MKTRLIIDGNAVYEIDEECMECRGRGKNADKVRVKKQDMGNTERTGRDTGLPDSR